MSGYHAITVGVALGLCSVGAFAATESLEQLTMVRDSAQKTVQAAVSNALSKRVQAYAGWQAKNPMLDATAVAFDGMMPTWETSFPLVWQTQGQADMVRICVTSPVAGEEQMRSAFIRLSASHANMKLVDPTCAQISPTQATSLAVIGVAVEVPRAHVLVTAASTPPGLTSGAATLSVPWAGTSTVVLKNSGVDTLQVREFILSAPFTLTHDCPGFLAVGGACELMVAHPDNQAGNRDIGRLEVHVGAVSQFVVPLRSSKTSPTGSLELKARN